MLIAGDETRILVAPQHLVAESRLEFRRAALEHLERVARCGATRMFVDLQHTTDIDASGLGVLVLLQKRGRDLMIATRLLHPPAAVKQMLALTKLDYLFEIEC
jgi:anti-anti-sigma regulatory factor